MSIADVFDFDGGKKQVAPGALLKSSGLKVHMGWCRDASHCFVTSLLGLWEIAGCQILESFIWMQMLCAVCVTGGSFVKALCLLLLLTLSLSLSLSLSIFLYSPSSFSF